MALRIRRIEKKDKQGINDLIEVVNKIDNLGYSLTEAWFDYVITEAGEGILVGYDDDQLIGLATCMVNSVDIGQAIFNVVVHPEFRNKGFGSSLYNKIVEHAKEQQVKTVEAYVKKRLNDAVGFAEKRSFRVVLYSWQMELELEAIPAETMVIHEEKENHCFRKATIEDGDDYARMMHECFGDDIGADALEQLLKDPSVSVYMLEHKGKKIGSTTIQFRKNLSLGYIFDVAVVKDYRGQGWGSYLLQRCILELKQKEIKTASLLVAGENKNALNLYKKAGFKEADTNLIMQKVL
ncbi:GNAT family N-acetyltransferase [Tindallia californiensis]|uniref:N-acetylglutamate synthase, GNAT family n=1 Tax=Tindallia californiensis TaxID=159292 RepID=A0A1H3LCW0_9FIRM|nr:GNAT family N-acetyltransferase [Tindallia californiensis]SDY61778.1 N-acetylglutamate synthase, GNAT family [Tindallia californiensis]